MSMSKFIKSIFSYAKKEFSSSKSGPKYQIFFIRHGESEWNKKNLFCGWHDAHLSENGECEAKCSGILLRKMNIQFDEGYTSRLTRSIDTLKIILKELGQEDIKVHHHWRLNERHYGNLTGMNKEEAVDLFGKEKVHIWRRSYNTPPPKMLDVNPYFNEVMNGKRYGLEDHELPLSESLKDTIDRTLPYWCEVIQPEIKKGKCVIVAAHGNSLRGIVKHIDQISDEGIQHLNLPTGVPFSYILGKNMLAIEDARRVQFFGDEEKVNKALSDLEKAKSS